MYMKSSDYIRLTIYLMEFKSPKFVTEFFQLLVEVIKVFQLHKPDYSTPMQFPLAF